jgi:hypothetical protein
MLQSHVGGWGVPGAARAREMSLHDGRQLWEGGAGGLLPGGLSRAVLQLGWRVGRLVGLQLLLGGSLVQAEPGRFVPL